MTAAATPTRHSTRASQPPVTLAEEQAASALSQLEQRDVAAALRLSLQDSWDSDEESDEHVVEAWENDDGPEEEEKKEAAAAEVDEVDCQVRVSPSIARYGGGWRVPR
mgnify:CR=1 FL=1